MKKNKDDDEVKEDPIAKAEREFFEIIKKVVFFMKKNQIKHKIVTLEIRVEAIKAK